MERTGGQASHPVAIRIENVSKAYRLGEHRSRPAVLAQRAMRGLRRRRDEDVPAEEAVENETLLALEDISAELRSGEATAIVGRNGAGKSTLLKLISKIALPSEGRITVFGRVATLLEVGTGFHPELTGRQNVFLNGTVLGMRRSEIEAKFDEIVEFSGVERFLDTPVKRYSSGMYVRLGFAIAAHLEPEILLVDEVLAVGDQEFQQKCVGKMHDVAGEGRTVIFVSHNLNAVQRLCDRALLLEKGRLVHEGTPAEVVADYLSMVEPEQAGGSATMVDDVASRPGTGEARLRRVTMSGPDGSLLSAVHIGQRFSLTLEYEVHEPVETAIEVGIWTLEGTRVASALSVDRNGPALWLTPSLAEVTVDFDQLTLVPGDYYFSVHLRNIKMPPIDYVERAIRFKALNLAEDDPDHYRWAVIPSVRPATSWAVAEDAGVAGSAAASLES